MPFGDSNYILSFHFNNFVKKCKIIIIIKKKKDDPYFPKFWIGQKRANKHLFI